MVVDHDEWSLLVDFVVVWVMDDVVNDDRFREVVMDGWLCWPGKINEREMKTGMEKTA